MLTPEQQEQRKSFLGASEVAAVLGVSPFGSAMAVWAEKTGRTEPFQGNENTDFGNWLEKPLIDWYAERFPDEAVFHNTRSYQAPGEHSWMGATPDGFVIPDGKLMLDPGKEISEGVFDFARIKRSIQAKTAHWTGKDSWGEEMTSDIPSYYLIQVQWEMEVLRLLGSDVEVADLPVLVDRERRVYRVRYSPDLVASIVRQARAFWQNCVLEDVPPEPDASDACRELLGELYPGPKESKPVPASTQLEDLASELATWKYRADKAAKEAEIRKGKLKMLMGSDYDSFLTEAGKGTWRAGKDTKSIGWEGVARGLAEIVKDALGESAGSKVFQQLVKEATTTKPATRRFTFSPAKGADHG